MRSSDAPPSRAETDQRPDVPPRPRRPLLLDHVPDGDTRKIGLMWALARAQGG
jgi:hypothetical protein